MAVRHRTGAGLRRAPRGSAGVVSGGRAARLVFPPLLYIAAALAATWPAARSFGSAFAAAGGPGYGEAAPGDHLQTVYRFWLVGHQLEHGAAPWRDPYSFQPLVHPQISLGGWPFGFLFWPLDSAFGPVAAWNALLLGTVVAAGLLTYAWLRALGVGPGGALVGGLAFALAPYRIEQSGGHLLGWIAVLLPLSLLALERSRSSEGRAAHMWGGVAAAALVSIPLSGQVHLALGALPLVVAYAAVRARGVPLAWAAGGVLAAAGVGLLLNATVIAGSLEAHGRSLSQVRRYSAGWGDLVHRRPRSGGEERYVFLGWLTPLLALGGLALLARRRSWLAAVLGLAAIVPIGLALGTHLPLYPAVWHVFPPLRYPRVPGRLLPIADLALAALAAVAVAALLARVRGRAPALVLAAALVLVGADLVTRPLEATAADEGNRAYAALERAPAGRVLELPLFEPGVHDGSVYEYYELQAPRQHPGGYSTLAPRAPFDFYDRMRRLDCGAWLPGDAAELRRLGITRLVFHRGLYRAAGLPGAWFAWRSLAAAGYRPAAGGGPVTLFAPGRGPVSDPPFPEPPHGRPLLCEGWAGRTMAETRAPLWLWGSGSVRLQLAAPRTTELWIWVDGRPAARVTVTRRIDAAVRLRGAGWHLLMLQVPAVARTAPPPGVRLERIAHS
ncbi:MAG: hypothetical protein E6G67_07460 [Actinobacteria bacterium]|nr:MAG: hypothetical protein E6G67_07460 [Actinomycetota bacterium]